MSKGRQLPTSRIETELIQQGYSRVAGIDEAGLGPLAGPVVAAAVVFVDYTPIPGLNDSKQVTEKKREELFDKVKEQAEAVGISVVPPSVVDEINVYWAGRSAMIEAVQAITPDPDYLLIDGNKPLEINLHQKSIIKGDSVSMSIAAASVVAKVTRDRMMREYHKQFPHYGFDTNKGYRSPKHLQALQDYGPCILHRRSFKDVGD